MNEVDTAKKIKELTAPLLEKGFAFSYFYEKGGDSSCVYICRFSKGKDFFDWREVSGADEIHLVAYVNGEYRFPTLKALHPKLVKKFTLKHLLKRPSMDERRKLTADILREKLLENPDEFLGIKL